MPINNNAPEYNIPVGEFLRHRPTFGFIVTWGLSNPYASPMWWGAVEAAEALDVNLVGFGDYSTPSNSFLLSLAVRRLQSFARRIFLFGGLTAIVNPSQDSKPMLKKQSPGWVLTHPGDC